MGECRPEAKTRELAQKAAEKFRAGDMPGACTDAKAALAKVPDYDEPFGISMLACRRSRLPDAALPKPEPRKPAKAALPPEALAAKNVLNINTKVPLLGMKAPGDIPGAAGPKGGGSGWDEAFRRLAAMKAVGDYGGVLSAAGEVLQAEPDNQEALDAKGLAQNRLGDHEGALETAEHAIEGDPNDAVAHANMAFALGALGDREGMLASLKTAAALEPAKARFPGGAGIFPAAAFRPAVGPGAPRGEI